MRHLLSGRIAVELAEQGIAVLLGPVGEVRDEVLDLFARGFPKRFHPAEIGRIGLDQVGIQLMLADDLAEPIADCATAAVAVGRLWRELLRLSRAAAVARRRTRSPRPSRCRCRRLCASARLTARVSATRISAPWTRDETLEGSASPYPTKPPDSSCTCKLWLRMPNDEHRRYRSTGQARHGFRCSDSDAPIASNPECVTYHLP